VQRSFNIGGVANNQLAVDGDFGPQTQAMVIRFQDWADIEKDGIAGPDTWGKLLEVRT